MTEVPEMKLELVPIYAWFEDPDINLWALQQWPESYKP
jgi:hypothetical protein